MKAITAALLAASSLAAAQSGSPADTARVHTETTFQVLVRTPYPEVAALFTPEGERAWAGKHWDPRYVYPQPARDEQGTVFTIAHGPLTAVWIIAQQDLPARHLQYIYVLPDLLITTIDVRFKPTGSDTTEVSVSYARTALTPEGDEHVRTLTASDQSSAHEWQQAIDAYLKSRSK